jgi:GAF domain-containing protein
MISFAEPGRRFLRVAIAAGSERGVTEGMQIPVDVPDAIETSLHERAFKSKQPCISNDYLNDPRLTLFKQRFQGNGTLSAASFPLFKDAEPIGILAFHCGEVGAFTPELIELLQRLAERADRPLP